MTQQIQKVAEVLSSMQVMWEQGWSATPLSQRPHIPVVGRVAVSLIFA